MKKKYDKDKEEISIQIEEIKKQAVEIKKDV